jgi:hypothetical protein
MRRLCTSDENESKAEDADLAVSVVEAVVGGDVSKRKGR